MDEFLGFYIVITIAVCMDIATKGTNADGELLLKYGEAFAVCVSRGKA